MRPLRQSLESAGFLAMRFVLTHCSRRRSRSIGTALGRFAFDVLRIRRRVAEENVRLRIRPGGGEPEVTRIARLSYEVLGRTFVDLMRFGVRENALWKEVDRAEVERIAAITREPRGCILVSAHFGNWELLLRALREVGVNISVIAGDQSNSRVDREVKALRLAGGVPTHSARHEIRRALRDLLEGRTVATLMDQDARHKGVFVEFLGAPASTHVGVVRLAMRTGAKLVPLAFLEDGDGYRAFIAPAWYSRPEASLDENLLDGASHYNRFLEAHVRRFPEQYMWAHRRWKTRPGA